MRRTGGKASLQVAEERVVKDAKAAAYDRSKSIHSNPESVYRADLRRLWEYHFLKKRAEIVQERIKDFKFELGRINDHHTKMALMILFDLTELRM